MSAVDTCASRSPLRAAHACANAVILPTSPARAALVAGWNDWSKSPSSESSHWIGLLRPTPRGSKPTRSNRSRSAAGMVDAIPVRKDTPGAPGPPGLNTSEPMRWRGSRARFRITARSMVGPAGAAGSSGTVSVPHWNPPSQACHAIAVAEGSAARATPAPAPTVRHGDEEQRARAPRSGRVASRQDASRGRQN